MSLCEKEDSSPEPGVTLPTVAVVGVNHRDTPISLRERLSIRPMDLPGLLESLCAIDGVDEAAAFSTCNRVELYTALSADEEGLAERTASVLCDARGVSFEDVRPSLYKIEGLEAARHLFEVACGLDSMVPGESEVLGQIKSAYSAAVDAGAVGPELSRLCQRAFRVAKDVRSRTAISERKVSVATVATDLARKVFGNFDRASVALVGAGNMAELTLRALVAEGAQVAVIANRSPESAERLAAEYGGKAEGLDRLEAGVLQADIIVASAAAPEAVIGAEQVGEALRSRGGRPMLLIDLGVPRNVDPAAHELDGVVLHDIDDLQEVVGGNVAYRLEQAGLARTLVAEEVRKFSSLLRTDSVADTIAELRRALTQIGDEECRRALRRLGDLSDEQRREMSQMASRIVGKILHSPIQAIKEDARRGDGAETDRMIRRLFGL